MAYVPGKSGVPGSGTAVVGFDSPRLDTKLGRSWLVDAPCGKVVLVAASFPGYPVFSYPGRGCGRQ
jgi:hypothetical protein